MKKLITVLAIMFMCNLSAQDISTTKKTHFDYSKSFISESPIANFSEIKKLKEKDFEDDERTVVVQPLENNIVFNLGFMEKTIGISSEDFSLIDKQWKFKLRDANFAFLVIGENYAIITLEEDKRTLVLINGNFKFK